MKFQFQELNIIYDKTALLIIVSILSVLSIFQLLDILKKRHGMEFVRSSLSSKAERDRFAKFKHLIKSDNHVLMT
ncbi:hypothetical protein T4A_13882 [Trichinella pseudospiralis]|uniref:Uncharacterized protein n=1 Tax=Trichinella pseudospiralis TaxID=6337 RepID=A0A0V1EIA4_TRIPS|nr:hypothetical protein T4A_13882 [Trichinella pseudospiralis]KRZ38420.1 hypothetical protein T4C_13608 [Trichinella pseudospiralis]